MIREWVHMLCFENKMIRKAAFTLVEVLIVIIIIGVLAGGLYLAVGGSDEKAKEAACLGNREAIKTAWSMYKFTDASAQKESLQKFMDNNYDGYITNDQAKCPSGGEYSAPNGYVVCNIHGGDNGTGDSGGGGTGEGGGTGGDTPSGGHYLYNTDNTIAIPDGNYWASMDDFKTYSGTNTTRYPTGSLIMIGDKCYIAFQDVTFTANPNNSPTTYIHDGGFREITASQATPVSWTQNSGTYNKGDICLYNGSYYIAQWGVSTNETPDNKKNPVNNAGAWIKLN